MAGSLRPSGTSPESSAASDTDAGCDDIPFITPPARAVRGRGVAYNIGHRFTLNQVEDNFDYCVMSHDVAAMAEEPLPETQFFIQHSKKIISTNHSPDIPFEQSINPYQGCEHGCIYCYARPGHAYLELSPGLDFERRIFTKPNAAALLRKELAHPRYVPKIIHIGGNTDCYQPAEKKLQITRSILQVMLETRHPVTLITKNALIMRDIDILAELAKLNLVNVFISVTSLDNELMRIMEPRTSSPPLRLKALHALNAAGIPVNVMVAPVIPFINDHEIETVLEAIAPAQPCNVFYTLVRLPYEVKDLFKDWLHIHFPDRAARVMATIRDIKGGLENDSRFGYRMTGQGPFAQLIEQRFKVGLRKYGITAKHVQLRTDLFIAPEPDGQLNLF